MTPEPYWHDAGADDALSDAEVNKKYPWLDPDTGARYEHEHAAPGLVKYNAAEDVQEEHADTDDAGATDLASEQPEGSGKKSSPPAAAKPKRTSSARRSSSSGKKKAAGKK